MDRSFLAILAEGFFSRLSFGIVSFALPLYALHRGLSLTEVGILVSLNTAVAILLKPATGHLADRTGLKKILAVAIGLRSLVVLLFPFAMTAGALYAIKTTHGISKSLRDPSINALIAERGGKKQVASAFAWYQTAKSVSAGIGKAIAGILLTLTASDYSRVFFAAFLVSVIPLFLVLFGVKERSRGKDPLAGREIGHDEPAVKEETETPATNGPSLFSVVMLGFLLSGPAHMVHGLFPVLATRYAGLSEAQTGLILLASSIATIVATPFFGWFSDHVSRKTVLMTRGFANVVSSFLYMLSSMSMWIAASGNVADHVGKAAFRPAWGALMTQVSASDRKKRARTMGLMSMGEDAGAVLGPITASFLWNTWGILVMLGVRILLSLATEIYAAMISGSMEEEEPRLTKPEASGKKKIPARG
jgi:MFS family permease